MWRYGYVSNLFLVQYFHGADWLISRSSEMEQLAKWSHCGDIKALLYPLKPRPGFCPCTIFFEIQVSLRNLVVCRVIGTRDTRDPLIQPEDGQTWTQLQIYHSLEYRRRWWCWPLISALPLGTRPRHCSSLRSYVLRNYGNRIRWTTRGDALSAGWFRKVHVCSCRTY